MSNYFKKLPSQAKIELENELLAMAAGRRKRRKTKRSKKGKPKRYGGVWLPEGKDLKGTLHRNNLRMKKANKAEAMALKRMNKYIERLYNKDLDEKAVAYGQGALQGQRLLYKLGHEARKPFQHIGQTRLMKLFQGEKKDEWARYLAREANRAVKSITNMMTDIVPSIPDSLMQEIKRDKPKKREVVV